VKHLQLFRFPELQIRSCLTRCLRRRNSSRSHG